MALFLVQHGKSMSKDVDPQQGLSEEGIADTERIASVAKGYGIQPRCILHSVKQRALQTAGIFAAALAPADGVEEKSGLKPMDDVASFASSVSASDDLMLVGHLPFMEKMTSYLITGSTEPVVFKFQNSGIVCLDLDIDKNAWFIKWALMPNIK